MKVEQADSFTNGDSQMLPLKSKNTMFSNSTVPATQALTTRVFINGNMTCSSARKHSICRRKMIGSCQGCYQEQIPIKRMLVFSTRCFHFFCMQCVDHQINKKISEDEEIKCPRENCKELLEENSSIYRTFSIRQKEVFDSMKLKRKRTMIGNDSGGIPIKQETHSAEVHSPFDGIMKKLKILEDKKAKSAQNRQPKKDVLDDLNLPEESIYPRRAVELKYTKNQQNPEEPTLNSSNLYVIPQTLTSLLRQADQ